MDKKTFLTKVEARRQTVGLSVPDFKLPSRNTPGTQGDLSSSSPCGGGDQGTRTQKHKGKKRGKSRKEKAVVMVVMVVVVVELEKTGKIKHRILTKANSCYPDKRVW